MRYKSGLGCSWFKDFLFQAGMAHHSGDQRQTLRAFYRDAMFESMLAGPLGHAAGEIYVAPGRLPSFVG